MLVAHTIAPRNLPNVNEQSRFVAICYDWFYKSEMTPDYQIFSLRERPEFADTCAAWSYCEWLCQLDGHSLTQAIDRYRKSTTSAELPQTWIAVCHQKPAAGMIRLKMDDCPTRLDLFPWLGGLFVHPLYRGQGLARKLIAHCEIAAKQDYNFDKIYLFTAIENFYAAVGWQKIGIVDDPMGLRTEGEALMIKEL